MDCHQPVRSHQAADGAAAREPGDEQRWTALEAQLNEHGAAVVEGLLPAATCEALCAMFESDPLFRSTILMERHGFGRGTYRYFDYPLPEVVAELRDRLYPPLARIANRWSAALGTHVRYPERLDDFLRLCREAGQTRPTPLLLSYGPGDYNCLHQDLYGETMFPLQAAILLSDRQAFTGGEFILTEQRPRRQTRAEVIPLARGDAAVFPVNERPVRGARGWFRARHRHGVSTIRSGRRLTLGIIFHDASG